MGFPEIRPRRLRSSESVRTLVRETRLSPGNFVYPMFVLPGSATKLEIEAMPGVSRCSPDMIDGEVKLAAKLGIPAVLLFGVNEVKDERGSSAWKKDGAVQTAVRRIKDLAPELTVITDVCLCAYTESGHCGVLRGGKVDNDATLELLAKTALSHAEAGADIVAPSDMMDGRVAAIRKALDGGGLGDTAIMAYSAKYASAFYGPFREAADCAPKNGDRKTYQMDPANAREAVREALIDAQEGADIVMVKPALAYLDIIRAVRDASPVPVAAYNVSGEYSMIKTAAARGLVDGEKVMMETLLAIKRAGADIIITYFALEAARLLEGE